MARGFKYHFKLAVGKESPSERVPSHTLFNIEYRFRTFESGPHFEKRDYDVLGTAGFSIFFLFLQTGQIC